MLIVFLMLISIVTSAQEILVLNFSQKGVAKYDRLIQGLEENIEINQNLEIEYLDLLKNNTPEYRGRLRDLYSYKYGKENFDHVLVIGKNVEGNFEELFSSESFIYLESNFGKSNLKIKEVSLEDYVEKIIQIHPNLKQVYLYSLPEAKLEKLQKRYKMISFYEVEREDYKEISKLKSYNNSSIVILGEKLPGREPVPNPPVYSYKIIPREEYTISLIRDYYSAGKNLALTLAGSNGGDLKDISYMVNREKVARYNIYLEPLGDRVTYFEGNFIEIDKTKLIHTLLIVFIVLNIIFIVIGIYWRKLLVKYKRLKVVAEESSRVKDKFLANMTHELRTPLNGILGMTELMIRHKPNKRLEIIDGSAKHLLSIVNDILDLSKLNATEESINLSLVDIRSLVNEIIYLFTKEKNIGIECFVDMKTPQKVYTDYIKVKKILINLMGNAIKYTDRGRVSLKIEVVTQSASEAALRFSVTDTGIGIPRNKIHKIFESFHQVERFHSRGYGGTGLGLTIVKKLLDVMESTLKIESRVGKGSTFSFQLNTKIGDTAFENNKPTAILVSNHSTRLAEEFSRMDIECILADEEEAEEIAAEIEGAVIYSDAKVDLPGIKLIDSIEESYSLRGEEFLTLNPFININLIPEKKRVAEQTHTLLQGRILVVEDNRINVKVLSEFLKDKVEVRVAYSGAEARSYDLRDFDLILMDIELPDTTGIELARELDTDIPIVALTAHSVEEFKTRALEAGMADFLTKPINFKKLEFLLKKYLNSDIHLLREDYGDEFLDELIDSFLIEYDASLPLIEKGSRDVLHKLKGSLGYFNDSRLLHLLDEVEKSGENTQELSSYLASFTENLRRYRRRKR
ncbi:hypothetical protein PM10SUCC1_06240 [Propionigenium maris DSM 9537]|uniref:histidine kinase n=1 Tax=Propionigenium maris DSM 9537 TaxID=1123000 RepID=A0A9W6GJN1_9FUSO|nr:ATP-binding protein [Propionigenium maris]GLI55109.1 hypothetical protein PM10SUCC1_06240 [Propionigenium maris DSM 9537]